MEYHHLEALRGTHPAWRLLRADHVAFIVSFLYSAFVASNRRVITQHELIAKLEDYLFHLRDMGVGEDVFPQSASAYLEAWASDQSAWLRKYYVADSDEPHFDLTPATERAIEWLVSLEQRQFVGTESRLMMVFELLHQIMEGTQADPQSRITELERQKQVLDAEISRIHRGEITVMNSAQVKDRFVQMESTARRLLADFRQVEQNFRRLDRTARERIALWEGGKGELLGEIFGDRDAIADSDEGKSFRAFWDFLTSSTRQEELSELLHGVFALESVQDLKPDRRLLRIHYDWLEAGDVAQRTVARLSEQLRRLIDDRAMLENRRIFQLIREAEQHAIDVRNMIPLKPVFMEIDDAMPTINLAMDRPLFHPPVKAQLLDALIVEGEAGVAPDVLFVQSQVDKELLASRIRRELTQREAVSLADLLAIYPLEYGLAEVIVYLTLASEDPCAFIDDEKTQVFEWCDSSGSLRRATSPLVIFMREIAPSAKKLVGHTVEAVR